MPDDGPRAIVDTNVWISAFINPGGAPARILDAARTRRFVPVVSRSLLDEIREVVNRPKVRSRCRLSDEELAAAVRLLEERGLTVVPTGALNLCRDPKDDFLLESAILSEARFLVSRDDDLKRDLDLITYLRERGVEVLSVAQFLELLAQGSTP